MGEPKATFSSALEVLQCSKTITSYDRSQRVLLALSVCDLRGTRQKGAGFGSTKGGGVSPSPYSPQNSRTPLRVTHWLAAAPVLYTQHKAVRRGTMWCMHKG